ARPQPPVPAGGKHHPPAALLRRRDAHARSAAGGGADVPGALGRGARERAVTTRAAFFAKIRGELQQKPALFAASTEARPEHPAAQADTIRRELAERWPATLEAFRVEFERVAGVFHRVASLDDVAPAIDRIARERGARRLVSWPRASVAGDGLSRALTTRGLGVHEMPAGEAADGAERARLRAVTAHADLGLTGVDLAVAETGTLVLVSGAGRPRSTS